MDASRQALVGPSAGHCTRFFFCFLHTLVSIFRHQPGPGRRRIRMTEPVTAAGEIATIAAVTGDRSTHRAEDG